MQSSCSHGVMAKQFCLGGDYTQTQLMKRKERRLSLSLELRASLDATAASAAAEDVVEAVAEVGKVTEVTVNTFWPIVKAAGDKTVVVDMYTQWSVYHLIFNLSWNL